jgi:transposase InsO family protein
LRVILGINDNNLCRWRGLYGSQGQANANGSVAEMEVDLKRLRREVEVLRQAGIHSRRRPKRRVRTTDSRHNRPVAPNLLQRDFSADAPNEKCVGDIVGG